MSLISDPDLNQVLTDASPDDLGVLADYITDKGKGRISLSEEVCKRLHGARQRNVFPPIDRALIAEELAKYGGNSVMNLLRGGAGVAYAELVCDVASHLGAEIKKGMATEKVELAILAKLMLESINTMTTAQRKEVLEELGQGNVNTNEIGLAAFTSAVLASEILAARLAFSVGQAASAALLGRVAAAGATTAAGRGFGALLGPVGWAVTGLWTIYDMSSPAYRVTVPCVIQLGYMRNKQKAQSPNCVRCNAPLAAGARFCSQCGTPVERKLLN